ncbi:MAG: hypothetical protein WC965_01590 [Thiohalomonadaceae bacterium]
MDELRQFLRDKDGQPVGVLLASKGEDGRCRVGWSVKHPKDGFNKKLGVTIARGRLRRGTKAFFPGKYRRDLEKFKARAESYFK